MALARRHTKMDSAIANAQPANPIESPGGKKLNTTVPA